MTPFGPGVPLVIDTSAWARQREPAVAERWAAALEAKLLASCPVAALEILATARDQREFDELERDFAFLPQAPVTESVCRAALSASGELQARRRLPAADYLIAAAAAERGFGVLHQDRHFDLLATVLGFQSVKLSVAP
ncbi:MAG: PIN domain-containing protein [Pseudonocardiaceae bacterium]